MIEQKNYIQILENRIKDKDSIYLQVVAENKKMKADINLAQDWNRRSAKKLRESANFSSAVVQTPQKNLKKTTSAKIFKGSDLEVSSNSINLKVE